MYGWLVAFTAALGGFVFGYEIGIISQVLLMRNFRNQFAPEASDSMMHGWVTPPDLASWIAFAFLMGCAGGAVIAPYPSEYIGRKWAMFVGAVGFLVGALIQTVAEKIGVLYLGRVFCGVGVGIASATIPLYISETSESEVRGKLGTCYQLMITFGIFVAFGTNSLVFAFMEQSWNWRLSFALQIIPCLLMMGCLIPLPNSPRWLIYYNRNHEALRVIAKLRGKSLEDSDVQRRFNEIKRSITLEQQEGRKGWIPLFFNEQIRFRTFLSTSLQVCQQLTGINITMFYAGSIFSALDLAGGQKLAINTVGPLVLYGLFNFICTIPCLFLIDRVGRRSLMIIGSITIMICNFTIFILQLVTDKSNHDQTRKLGIASVAMVFLMDFFYAWTWGPVAWVYCSEIFPLRYRARGTAVSTCANWITAAVLCKFAPYLLQKIGGFTWLILSVFGIMMTIVSCFAPETRGKTLEEIDKSFTRSDDSINGYGEKSHLLRSNIK